VTAALPQPGQIYHVGADCGVPFTFRPIYFQILLRPVPPPAHADTIWLEGYELTRDLHVAGERRSIYVITAGLRLVTLPPRADRRARNTRPVVPRQRTNTTTATTTGRPR
jgi:hypothetical protein